MVESVAERFVELEPADFYLLSGVEHGMRFAQWVRRDRLPELSGLDENAVDYRIDRCLDRELIERRTMQYEGYQLQVAGYDALALRTFAERDTVEGFGAPLGVGKESDVYEVQSYKPLALKFHREGYTDFREVHREREYTADREHVSWLYTARVAAEKEHEVLEALYPTVAVPRPIDQNRHAIVMDQMDGVELSRSRLDPEQVVGVLDLVLAELATAYTAGWVHADLSEYNVFVGAEGVTVFDWPQAVPTSHENADDFLDRDVANVVNYFERKYPNELPAVDPNAVAAAVRNGSFDSVEAA
ncbi:MAG: serine/threonine-protein kinase RIO2 [Halobacteriales archaeon]